MNKDFYNPITGKVVSLPEHLIEIMPHLIPADDPRLQNSSIDPCVDCHCDVPNDDEPFFEDDEESETPENDEDVLD